MTLQPITASAACALLIISVFTDVRDNKIYNAVTLPFALLGLTLNTVQFGTSGLLNSLGGIGIGLALFFVSAFLGRILGAGDCKLFAAVGAFVGWHSLLWIILYSLLAGGVLAILLATWRGILKRSLTGVWRSAYARAFLGTPMDITQSGVKTRLPYAVAICAGSLWVIWRAGQGV